MGLTRKNQLLAYTQAGLIKLRIERIEGREAITSNGRLIDFCTTNYLGFDFHPDFQKMGAKYAAEWGSLTGWSRLEADPIIYSETERRISDFLGVKDAILSHTITITNFSVMSAIVGKGVIFADSKVHTVVYESARLARDHGATLVRFEHQNIDDLEKKLKNVDRQTTKLICVDGVYSISTEQAPIRALQNLCEKYNAWLYVDDAHGFGVLGKPTSGLSYGTGGQGIIAHQKGDYKRTFYVSSFGKAFCTHSAFITIPDEYNEALRENCMQYIYSAPMSPYVIGMVNAAMDLNNSEGDFQRKKLESICHNFMTELKELNLNILNEGLFPVIYWNVGTQDKVIPLAQKLLNNGVMAGLRAYPVVPENECGFRFGLTSLHTEHQIEKTIAAIRKSLT